MRTSSIFFAYSILTGILEAARFNWWARQWMPIIQGNSNFMRVIKPDLFPIIDTAPSVAMAAFKRESIIKKFLKFLIVDAVVLYNSIMS